MSLLHTDGIYHITPRADWERAQPDGAYRAASLQTEGFIHCSTGAQVMATANRYYTGQPDLLLLEIDPLRTGAELRYEGLPGGEQFPHLYGALPLAAVMRVLRLEPEADGRFIQAVE